jgi:head-tail adaptor
MIAPRPPIGDRPHHVFWQNPGTTTPDSEGGGVMSWVDCVPPATWCKIEAATAQTLERLRVGTVTAVASHVISGPFHPQLTVSSRGIFNGRTFQVTNAVNVDERSATTAALCTEVL